jgi:hypothetical protein
MTTIRPFPIVDLAGDIIKHIDIPCEVDAEIPGENGILMTEEGSAAVRKARIELLKNTFWLVEYEARMSVVEVFPIRYDPIANPKPGRPDLGFFAPGQDTLWPLHHAQWIRQVYPTPPPRLEDTL